MLRKILIAIAVLVLIAAGGAYYLFSNLDSFVKAEIEKYGTQITGTSVKLSNVHISLSTGEGTITGLVIRNPEGYSTPNAFEMNAITVRLDVHSMAGKGPIIIKEIAIEKPLVIFEALDATGATNLHAIAHNAQNYSGAHKKAAAVQPENNQETRIPHHERNIVIDDFTLQGSELKIVDKLVLKGKDISAPLSPIHLTGIGGSEGVPPGQAAKQIILAITNTAIHDASERITKQKLGDVLDKSKIGNTLKGLLGR